MKVSEFDYNLPDAAIALRPVSPRDHARMLKVNCAGNVSDHKVIHLPDLLKSGDVLVVNETKVFPSALTAVRAARPVGGGGDVTISINLHQKVDENCWKAFVRPAKRVRISDILSFGPELSAEVSAKTGDGEVELTFSKSGASLMRAIDGVGSPPLPPYIAKQRPADARDVTDYQTVYAARSGSVAAPTAGLHFTPSLISELAIRGIEIRKITLHVGAGTFLPIKTEDTNNHIMHSEWFDIDAETAGFINDAKDNGRRIIAVGTTSLRALESAAQNGRVLSQASDTDIFISPGYEFQIIDGLMTNFHLPKSTLFMLVCALCGTKPMKRAYSHAIKTGYRFYSYGDSSLLWKAQ